MRGRQCNNTFIAFVLGVFASGVLCGYYYESTVSLLNINNIGVRVVPAESVGGHAGDAAIVEDNGHLHVPSNLKQHLEVDSKSEVVHDNNKVADRNSNSAPKGNALHDTKVENDGDGNTNRKNDFKKDDLSDVSEEHHSHINRKEFGLPTRLKPKHSPPGDLNLQQGVNNRRVEMRENSQQPAVQPPAMDIHHLQQVQQQVLQQQQQQQLQNIQVARQQQQQQQPVKQELHAPVDQPQGARDNVMPPAVKPAIPGEKPLQPPVANPQDTPKNTPRNAPDKLDDEVIPKVEGKIFLSVVVCGDRTDEALVMIKSAAILTTTPLHFHIFAEDELQSGIANKIKSWPYPYSTKITFNIHDIAFPPGENAEEWKKMFKKCATQRLFLPDLLTDTDALLYVDTDILFIRPLEYIWSFFKKFNATQLAAMTPEHETTNIGWYNRFARHPYYGVTGLNSGVMLMNLTRMRATGWSGRILPIYRQYKTKITWGDQDLINILFHFHPEMVFVYPCEWNVRPDHCMYSLNCHRITQEGVSVIHGNRGVYHNEKQLPFRIIYEAFRDYKLGTNLDSGLVQPLKQRFTQQDVASMYCSKALAHPLISTLQKSSSRH